MDESKFAVRGTCSVSVTVSITPIEMHLAGTIDLAGHAHILIGQHFGAFMDAGSYHASASDTYTWSVGGGRPFNYYSADDSRGYLDPFTLPIGMDLTCTFAQPVDGGVTVSCTAYLVSIGQSVTVSRTVSVDKPSCTLAVGIGVSDTSETKELHFVPDRTSNANYFTIWGADVARIQGGGSWNGSVAVDDRYGFLITAVIETPVPYVTSEGNGQWELLQKVFPSRTRVNSGVSETLSLGGILCLDTTMPYDGPYGAGAGSAENMTMDAPSDSIGGPITQLTVHDSFKMYIMYQPPENGFLGNLVPVRYAGWYWGTQAAWDDSLAQWNVSPNQGWGYGPDFPDHPVWSNNVRDAHY